MRAIAATCALALSLAGCTTDEPTPPADNARPDIILIVVDTLRADHLSTYGYHRETSPGLTRLAERGVVYEDATSQSSWTLPSMASMLSGRHVFLNALSMPPTVMTLAERLSEEGYETAGFVGNSALIPAAGFARGFDTYMTRQDTGGETWDYRTLETAFTTWLDSNPPGDAPRFYYLHYLDPHEPYGPAIDVELNGSVNVPTEAVAAWQVEREARGEGSALARTFEDDRAFIEQQVDAYDREIVVTDASITRMLDRIFASRTASEGAPDQGATARDAGLLSDALERHLVVVASDHGEVLWERRHHPKQVDALEPDEQTLRNVFWRDHSYHMFQSLLNTPLIVAGAGFEPGLRDSRPVENVDIMPTLLRAAGASELDADGDGQALQGDAPSAARPYLFAHSNEATVVRAPDGAAGRDGDWKLVFPTDTGFSFGMPMQLYDLGVDTIERNNAYANAPKVAGALLGVRQKTAAAFTLYDDANGDMPEEQRQELIRLGYINPDEEDETAEDDDHR